MDENCGSRCVWCPYEQENTVKMQDVVIVRFLYGPGINSMPPHLKLLLSSACDSLL